MDGWRPILSPGAALFFPWSLTHFGRSANGTLASHVRKIQACVDEKERGQMKRALIHYNRGLEKYVARYVDDGVFDIRASEVGRCLPIKEVPVHKECRHLSWARPLATSSC